MKDDDDYCPNSKDNKHEPNWNSVTTDYDGDTLYVDVNCKHCQRSGCLGSYNKLTEDINW